MQLALGVCSYHTSVTVIRELNRNVVAPNPAWLLTGVTFFVCHLDGFKR